MVRRVREARKVRFVVHDRHAVAGGLDRDADGRLVGAPDPERRSERRVGMKEAEESAEHRSMTDTSLNLFEKVKLNKIYLPEYISRPSLRDI